VDGSALRLRLWKSYVAAIGVAAQVSLETLDLSLGGANPIGMLGTGAVCAARVGQRARASLVSPDAPATRHSLLAGWRQ
jgi:hypothetical protein